MFDILGAENNGYEVEKFAIPKSNTRNHDKQQCKARNKWRNDILSGETLENSTRLRKITTFWKNIPNAKTFDRMPQMFGILFPVDHQRVQRVYSE